MIEFHIRMLFTCPLSCWHGPRGADDALQIGSASMLLALPALLTRTLLSLAVVAAVAPGQSRAATPTLTTLATFYFTNGAGPSGGLIADASGNLFGTTTGGGANSRGTVFEIAKTAGGYASTVTTLLSFCSLANCTDGAPPEAGLIVEANGNLLGTTGGGGVYGFGTVFEIAKTASGYASTPTTLVSFNGTNGAEPDDLIADANGNLFGTTYRGGAHQDQCGFNCGTVFEIVKTAGGYASTSTTLVSFCAQANCTDGAGPSGGLIADANGNLFGTTQSGGAYGGGTVFEIAKTDSGYASTPTTLVSFCAQANCTDGSGPRGGLIADANGNLFGTTTEGGEFECGSQNGVIKFGCGTVFEITKTAGGYASTPTTLVSFNGGNGEDPGGLIADANGNLFGTTSFGGPHGVPGSSANGTVFEIAKTASGYASTPTTLATFYFTNGALPEAGLIADASGNLFGTTSQGGSGFGSGTVFEITGSGFVAPVAFAGTPGKANCYGKSVSALARQYRGLNNAAASLGFASVEDLQEAILGFCVASACDRDDEHARHSRNDECRDKERR